MTRRRGLFLLFTIIILFNFSQFCLYSSTWWKTYFTSPNEMTKDNNPEKGLIRLINDAKRSFYGAFYDISSKNVALALEHAQNRGVDVKLVVERDHLNRREIQRLEKIGISIVSDNRRGLMHNKFAIIDKEISWTGSYNLTMNGANRNNNNAIEIFSQELANIYLDEFNEMYEHNIFGNRKELKVFPYFRRKKHIKIEDVDIKLFFSPEDNIEKILIDNIRSAKKSIYFMAFSFTSDKIAEEMIDMFKSGVKVYGIMEKRGANSKYSEYIKLKVEGIPVRMDRNRYFMHHKVIIIDELKVHTGSYNFSKNANINNDENILIIQDKSIANEYLKEFRRLY